ncbi:MAG: hypothetical protein HYS06_08210 [Methylocystis sp.]|nr:hypothetical protein [Methylocystis sp.]MBI3275556.1 hypothetical protein [Methylocystis sp.]
MAILPRERIAFLYRTDQGRIDRATWLQGAAWLVGALVPLALGWRALSPYAEHDLSKSPLFVPMTVAAYAYALVYALAVVLIAISWVNLSAKRFRDRGRPAPLALAGLLPLTAFLAGAAHFLQPRVAAAMPYWYVSVCDAVLIGVVAWTIYELALRGSRQ